MTNDYAYKYIFNQYTAHKATHMQDTVLKFIIKSSPEVKVYLRFPIHGGAKISRCTPSYLYVLFKLAKG